MTITARSRARALTTGVALLALSMAGATVALAPAAPAGAQESDDDLGGDEGGDDLGGEPEEAEEIDLEVSETALYTHPITDALPPILIQSVPPQAVCVVEPNLCPDALDPLSSNIAGAISELQDNMEVSPVQPVPEDTVAASYLSGNERYESAMLFELPDVPDDEEVSSFRVSLPMEQPSYQMDSPLFQDTILATFEAIADRDPAVMAERLPEALQEEPIDIDTETIGLEACPLTEAFEPGGPPESAHADDLPRDEETGEALVDCVIGGGGSFDEESEEWVFDLTFAAEAWNSGEVENHGVLLRPTGGPNLAFGDPDPSTNAQIVLSTDDATVAMDTSEPPPEAEPLDAPELDEGLDEGEDLPEPEESEEVGLEEEADFDAPEDAGEAGSDFDDAAGDDADVDADAPDVADSPEVSDDEMAAPEDGGEAGEESAPVDEPSVASSPELDEATPAGATDAPWWIWLLVPAFGGGAYLVSTALTSPVAAAAGGQGGGAMTRLIASRSGSGPINPA